MDYVFGELFESREEFFLSGVLRVQRKHHHLRQLVEVLGRYRGVGEFAEKPIELINAEGYVIKAVGLDLADAQRPRRVQQVLIRLEILLALVKMLRKRLAPAPCYFQHLIIRNHSLHSGHFLQRKFSDKLIGDQRALLPRLGLYLPKAAARLKHHAALQSSYPALQSSLPPHYPAQHNSPHNSNSGSFQERRLLPRTLACWENLSFNIRRTTKSSANAKEDTNFFQPGLTSFATLIMKKRPPLRQKRETLRKSLQNLAEKTLGVLSKIQWPQEQ